MTFSTPKGDKNQLDLDTLNEFFASTVQAPGPQADIQPTLGCDDHNSFQFRELEGREVLNLLNCIKIDTATGRDDIPGFLLKKNRSLASCNFPTNWKQANVSAVWKGDRYKKAVEPIPSNYRPVSVLLVLGRLLEKAAATQLSRYCEESSIVCLKQYRRARPTIWIPQ